MTPLGKSLVFYFKYSTEMQRLCESEKGELEGLPEPEKTRDMAQEVGAKAWRQAADLLEACAENIEEHIKSIGRCLRITSRRLVEKNWSLRINVWPRNRQRPSKSKLEVGVEIVRIDKPELVPWIWRGGDEPEQKLEYVLRERLKVRSQDVGWETGSVGLDRIPILPDAQGGFDVDREPLVERVKQSILLLSVGDLQALWF